MKEILAGELDIAICKLQIDATKTFDDGEFQVWEMSDEEFKKLDLLTDSEWEEHYGWWAWSEGANKGSVEKRYSINGHWLMVWESDYKSLIKYKSLIEYIYNALNLSTIRNICNLTVELAHQNGMTLGELFNKYQSNNKIKNK